MCKGQVALFTSWLAMVVATQAVGSEMIYFADPIDYWDTQGVKPNNAATPAPKRGKEAFDWQSYLDPGSDEFFREGDYLPPAPFMEVARRPTDANLKNWAAYVDARNRVMERLQERMVEYGASTGATTPQVASSVAQASSMQPPEMGRFVGRFYFDSTCPHCRRMAPEIARLEALGLGVEALQVDSGDPEAFAVLGTKIQRAGRDDLARNKIDGAPTLLIADLKTRQVYRFSGYQSAESILAALSGKS